MPEEQAPSEFVVSVIRLNREMGEVKTAITWHGYLLLAILGAIIGTYFK